jgi:putative oxidoreductase
MQLSHQQVAIMAATGRIILASLFILGSINKMLNFGPTAARMGEVGLEPASILLPLTILLELTGGLAVAIGRKGAAPAAAVLAIFTLATNYFFHDFWNMEGQVAALELSLFFKNLSIAGGLLFVAAITYKRV